jgi:hypothetical protein
LERSGQFKAKSGQNVRGLTPEASLNNDFLLFDPDILFKIRLLYKVQIPASKTGFSGKIA